jgi:hypothetical protein
MHNIAKTPLPEETMERIAAEERFRLQVREELQRETKRDSSDSKTLKFLNSAFGIFLLTTIFVSGLGGIFTYWNQRAKEKEIRRQQQKKLMAEFDFRLNELDTRISEISKTNDPDRKGVYTIYVYRAALGTQFQPALPEFRDVTWAGIIIQLDNLGISENSSQAIAATRDLASDEYAGKGQTYSFFAPGYLEERAKILHAFNDDAWKKIDPDRWSNRSTN